MAVPKRKAARKPAPRVPECFFGLETELSIHAYPLDGSMIDALTGSDLDAVNSDLLWATRQLSGGWNDGRGTDGCWLPNGGLIYYDFGSHPECAAPETSDPLEALRQHRMMEELVAEAAAELNRADRVSLDRGHLGFHEPMRRMVMKSSVDAEDNTFGTHENYLIPWDFDVEGNAPLLGSFLASRVVFTGLGGIEAVSPGWRYVTSPRARHIETLTSDNTTHSRPLVNLRHEPHVDQRHHSRLHLIAGEANRLDFATWLKIGTTAIVVSMITRQSELLLDDLIFESPVDAMRIAAQLGGYNTKIRTERGHFMSPLDVQRAWASRAASYVSQYGERLFTQPESAAQVVTAWQETLEDLAIDPMRTVGRLDWTTKLWALRQYAEKQRLNMAELGHPKMRGFDLRWGEVGEHSIVAALERRGIVERLAGPTGVAHLTPPRDSRAALRGLLVSKHPDLLDDINWGVIAIKSRIPHASLGCVLDGVHDLNAAEITALGLDAMDGEEIQRHFALHDIRRHYGYDVERMEVEKGRAILASATDAPAEDRIVIATAVADGTCNSLQHLLRNGDPDVSSNATARERSLEQLVLNLYAVFCNAARLSGLGDELHRSFRNMFEDETRALRDARLNSDRQRSREDVVALLERALDGWALPSTWGDDRADDDRWIGRS